MKENSHYDVIIIGGSYAGLSAAMALGRSLRNVLVIDNGNPCNKQTLRSHNLLTWDGASPAEIMKKAKEQVLKYPTIKFVEGTVVDVEKNDPGFEIIMKGAERFRSKKILFATGVVDRIPEIENFSECWGISILHCPYCHGYEVKDLKTAVLGNGEDAYHLCMVLTHWTKTLTLLTNGNSTLTEEHAARLKEHNIKIIEEPVTGIQQYQGQIEIIHFRDSSRLEVPVLYAKLPFKQQCAIPERLGCKMTEEGHILVDENKKTSVHGIYAAGDNTSNGRSLSLAIAAGTVAGMMLHGELVAEKF